MLFFLIALLIIAIDQFTKIWIRASIPFGQSRFEIGFFRLSHIQNSGAAFGLFQDQIFPLIVVASVGIVALIVYALFIYRRFPLLDHKLSKSALGLILGGTVGNLIDRLRFGYVTDFIDFNLWPAFNIADSAVTIGVILFAYSLLSIARTKKQ